MLSHLSLLAALALTAHAQSMTGTGRQAYINSATDFCLYLPQDPTTQSLVQAESSAVAYCTNPKNGTRPLPDGFVKSAHFVESPLWKGVIGTYDPTVMGLGLSDCGGEYDNHGAEGIGNPPGAFVDNSTNWSQFLGACDIPSRPIFCLRACYDTPQSYAYCNNQFDLMGCLYTQPSLAYYQDGFDNCESDAGLETGRYNDTYSFKQGDAYTPIGDFPSAPATSACHATSSWTPKGVTYAWNKPDASFSYSSADGAQPTTDGGRPAHATSTAATSASRSGSVGSGTKSTSTSTSSPNGAVVGSSSASMGALAIAAVVVGLATLV